MRYHNSHSEVVFEYSKITPQIFVGTNQCCRTHFEKTLLKKDVTADISLEEKRVDTPFGVNYYLWLPVKDHHAPSATQFKLGVQFMAELVRRKEKIYVHCRRGHGRAPTLAAAYLMNEGMGLEDALRLIKKKRPAVHLNERQVSALKKFSLE